MGGRPNVEASMDARGREEGPVRTLPALLEKVSGWADTQTDVSAVLLVGSHARHQATPESDVDLVVLAAEPGRLLEDQAWLTSFGAVRWVEEEDWGKVRSLRVVYDSGLEVEVGVTDESWLAEPLDPGTQAVLADGVRLVYQRKRSIQQTLGPYLELPLDDDTPPSHGSDRLARAMAYAGLVLSLAVTLGVFATVARIQPLWPLPGFYFVELLVLAAASASLVAASHPAAETSFWITLGATLGFAWMGRLSVGAAYAPVAIVFGVAAIASSRHRQAGVTRQVALAILACVMQVGLILLLA